LAGLDSPLGGLLSKLRAVFTPPHPTTETLHAPRSRIRGYLKRLYITRKITDEIEPPPPG
jgi:hypothetical protein